MSDAYFTQDVLPTERVGLRAPANSIMQAWMQWAG
jgi:hypothetical protein